jgi:hypothetical protein
MVGDCGVGGVLDGVVDDGEVGAFAGEAASDAGGDEPAVEAVAVGVGEVEAVGGLGPGVEVEADLVAARETMASRIHRPWSSARSAL